ncbi:tripartite tricarboxylate transporter TctB family protein [Fodinicurvata sediminis]|uniref:tripartite tricarboxylate transporter TctB family protein n=1 Tax=Fodinicurvata sediminis TaxID=1121832 RepID=UPI0003B78465|nr:tripartite tricarboxylate transporter TctB family protein [Fodinicurvata sediminis]
MTDLSREQYLRAQRLRESVFAIATVAASVLFASLVIPAGVTSPASVEHLPLSPRFLPYVLSALIAIMALVHLAEAWFSPRPPDADPEEEFEPHPRWKLRSSWLGLLLLGYLFLPQWGGMLATAVAATTVLTAVGGERRLPVLLGIGVLVPTAVYFFFTIVVQVPLPAGSLIEGWGDS